ncbi:MAG: butyrate kinase [Oscillospiraceae bacterium]|nr:butyrate kinase [Oscillospiraceae bacterium]
MKESYKIFVINPGSTSTKLALFSNEKKLYETNVFHDAGELLRYESVNAQLPYRHRVIMDFLKEDNIDLTDVDAIVGRGGSCLPVRSGVYEVNDLLIADTAAFKGGMEHPSNLGVQLAREMQKEYGGRAFMVDPCCVDELCDMARMTGIKGVDRHVNMHTLNMRGVAMHHAKTVEKRPYPDCRFIVCHIDGGISISAHEDGHIIDCNNSGGGEGPYSPTRIGTVSAADLIDYCKGKDLDEVRKLAIRTGGFVSHFGTSSSDTVHAMMDRGDKQAARVWNGMLYQICKTVGAMAAVLCGRVDAILLTGGLLRFPDVEEYIRAHCGWIGPIYTYPGEVEHEAMAAGALRVLRGEEEAKTYTGIPAWTGWDD